MPGIRRVRRGRGFAYRGSQGRWLNDPEEIARIRRLAIPPAYSEVWICPLPNGHLQATGRDARGRKQYRYHPDWMAAQGEAKFERLLAFGHALPRIRARVARDLRQGTATLSQNLVLATLVRLLDTTLVRVGNDEYTRENGSFGLTTLRNPHAKVKGRRLRLSFRGKSGVMHDITIEDPRLARVVRRCQDLPGQDLFQYQDEDGEVRRIGSADVNDYIAAAAGARFTAKDFRTWHGSALALELACKARHCNGGQGFLIKPALSEVASRLRNTPAVCRSSYIHPKVLSLWQQLAAASADEAGSLVEAMAARSAEQRLLRFLRPIPTRSHKRA
ncbi:DNA topoisomerase IB [Paucibacter sp. R3-3]|uniref:DNA topoisomerase n=2 Tax=Roseateles agri TaxID=3098619 RepID=A0ABU5DGK5_9BURK|nr:DNA topoisomerase IB [Paucibacter sp. R3-3]MDY0745418.1 DNA topoisomerase IB [Paucibacter sp. R3-3]